MKSESGMFQVVTEGDLAVVSFGEDGPPNHFYHDECLSDLSALIEELGFQRMAFNLDGVQHIASGMIGIFTWLSNQGIHVELRNTSSHIRRALEALRLTNILVSA